MNKVDLQRPGDIRIHNGQVAWRHIESEYEDVVDDIIATLAPEEPYAYTVTPMPSADGGIPHQKIMTTRAQLRSAYEDMHRVTLVRKLQAVGEFRGDWYVFLYGLGEGLIKPTGQVVHTPTAVLFPTMGTDGITGELFWTRTAQASKADTLVAEVANLQRHEAFLACLRNADVEGVVALTHPGAQTAVRDYVADTGTLAALHSAEELASHLRAFFDRYEVEEISLVNRLATDWFVFAELAWVVREKGGTRRRLQFYTAEHAEIWPDGRFAARIGHGTEPELA